MIATIGLAIIWMHFAFHELAFDTGHPNFVGC
jgi:hypothetical protein